MPSIDSLPPITLRFRRADVIAFWILATSMVAFVIWVTAAWLEVRRGWAFGLAGAGVALAPGLFLGTWYEAGIEAWNRIAHFMTRVARKYALIITYYVLFTALGRAGSSLDIATRPPRHSKWLPLPNENQRAAVGDVPSATSEEYQSLWRWSRTGRRRWVWCLMPVMALLLLLKEAEQDIAPPSSTYTLY